MARIVFILIGALLAVTASAKLWMLLTDPFADLKAGYSVMTPTAAVIIEFGLLFLLTTRQPGTQIAATMVVFGGFLVASLRKLFSGEQGCGCFGALEVSPLVSSAINVAVLSAVVWVAIGRGEQQVRVTDRVRSFLFSEEFRRLMPVFGVGAILMALSLLSGTSFVQSVLNVSHPVSSMRLDLGELTEGNEVQGEMVIANRSDHQVRLVGVSKSCSCLATVAAGEVIPAGGEMKVPVTLKRKQDGKFHHRLRFYVDHPDQFSVDADITGRWISL